MQDPIVYLIFLVFTGASVLATLALYTRQSLLVAYIALGVILGPWGLKWVNDSDQVRHIANIGIIFLLFLLGLNLHPQNLLRMLTRATKVTMISSSAFAMLGYGVAYLFGFSITESLVVGATMMFSSTIIGLKLLPTTVLHHQHTGEVVISILLLQDLLAILTLLLLHSAYQGSLDLKGIMTVVLALPGLILFSFWAQKYILIRLISRFDIIQEYIFLMAIGWCLGIAELAEYFGLSHEMGAFIAGVALASSPISLFIAESLKPLRDFFLVLFFFSLGASFNLSVVPQVLIASTLLAVLILILKPLTFWVLLKNTQEASKLSLEVGVRLGQISEFSLLVAYLAHQTNLLGTKGYNLVQTTTILTFILSSYFIVLRYPTPIGIHSKLRRN